LTSPDRRTAEDDLGDDLEMQVVPVSHVVICFVRIALPAAAHPETVLQPVEPADVPQA
jgi:hypothetical protein